MIGEINIFQVAYYQTIVIGPGRPQLAVGSSGHHHPLPLFPYQLSVKSGRAPYI